MARGRSQFIGAAGQFYVSYGLAVRQIHASLTLGNAPSVDVVACSPDGNRSLSIQVKTSSGAYRRSRYGSEGYEWPVGAGVIGKHSPCFWYALVDLQAGTNTWTPQVFFVPSLWVANFVQPDFSMKVYFLPTTAVDLTRERWDLVSGYLAGESTATAWATSHPVDRLVQWGNSS